MASIGIGALGEPALAHVFEPLLGSALGHTAAVAVSVVIAYLLITVAQSIIGEIAPKLYTIQHAEDLARRIARPLQFFRVIFHPLILVLNSASNSLLRALGTDPDAEPEGGTPEELKRIIAESRTGGQPRRGRGQHADRGLPPARAGGSAGDDADPGRRHGRPVGDRPGRAPALRIHRPFPAGGHRGRQPGPGQGDRPRQPAGQADDGRGLRGALRAPGTGRPAGARDQAAG